MPVSSEKILAAKKGDWRIHITKKPLPESWLPKDIKGKDILCLASGGGQQAPILAAAGAHVTVLDASREQLRQDQFVAERDQLALKLIQGDMSDLSMLSDNSFDYIIHPISNLYVPDIKPVWKECYRVLRDKGILLASFYNPIVFVFDRSPTLEQQGLLRPKYNIPYSDVISLDKKTYEAKVSAGEAICFGHSLSDQINGQLEAGFYEDEHPNPRFLIENYIPTMIATKAEKL